MSLMNQLEARKIWLEAAEKVKDRVVSPSLYIALEKAHGITQDGDLFVLGFKLAEYPEAGHLRSSQNQGIIEKCISEIIGKKIRLLTIEGTTIQDYHNFKDVRQKVEQSRSLLSDKKDVERKVEIEWEQLTEKISREYAKIHLRAYTQQKALFMKDAFKLINADVIRLQYEDDSDEIEKRCLARVFDRLGKLVDVSPTWIAYEFFRLRDEGKL